MDKRITILEGIYGGGWEEGRLTRTRSGQLEYLTTMSLVDEYAPRPCRVLELGAGTGAYSLALAREGNEVTALELVEKNVEILREKARGIENLTVVRGDALDLGSFPDDAFDLTLCLGPLYHIYDPGDVDRALNEAIRVTRPGGVLLVAFLSVHAILYDNYLQPPPHTVRAGLRENFTEDFEVRHYAEQVFTGYDTAAFEALFAGRNVDHLTTAAASGMLELAEGRADFAMSDEDFRAFAAYHLHWCRQRELLGMSSHLLYAARKRGGEERA